VVGIECVVGSWLPRLSPDNQLRQLKLMIKNIYIWLAGLRETLAILSNPALMEQIREGMQAVAEGDAVTSLADFEAEVERRRNAQA
jgi:hypothetical protein